MNYFEFYVGDYKRDTSRLSMAEHGAFLMLLADYYANERPLPASLPELYRIAGAQGAQEQRAVKSVADTFFPVDPEDGLRHNARADAEIAKAQKRINAARANGAKGGRKQNPVGTHRVTGRDTQQETHGDTQRGTQQTTHSGEALQTPHEKLIEANASIAPEAGAATPRCPQQDIIALYHEILPELPPVNDWPEVSATHLRNLWRKNQKRQTLDFWRRLFEHVRKSEFLMGEKSDFQASLIWLVKPANFAKVVNGNYDNRGRA